ncbi:nsun2 [Symbiodinium sp. CCMP2592]|nr:nsun2 [Symbiodinium sp. CCMP2592]
MAETWPEVCVRLLGATCEHRVLDMTGACSRELAQSLHNGLLPGTIPSGLLVANVAKAESLEDLVREVDLVHRSPVVFTVSQPQRFPQLLTASPGEGFAKWTAPTKREPSGQFLMEFDRVMCVPGQHLRPCEACEGQLWHRHPLHVRILQRGLGLLRPGGRLVFVACGQLHPVENEAVIAAALSRYGPPSVQIEDARQLLACPSSLGCTSWSIPNPIKGEEPSHFLSWDDVPLKLRDGKVLRTMFPPKYSEPNGLELGSQLARCLRLDVGPGLFLAVLVKESTAPRICSSPCPVEEDEQSSLTPGSNIMVRSSGASARVVGRGSGPYAGLVKIRYPDRSTYHLEASELQPLSSRPTASPAFTLAFKAACLALTMMSTLFYISPWSRCSHTLVRRLKWHSGVLLSACLAFACMRSRGRAVRSPVGVAKSPLPGSRIVRGCSNVPQPVQSFCSFFGWDLCWEKFRDCLAYRTADKRDLYLVSAAVFQLRVPEQLRQTLCGMPVLTRCDVSERRYWGTDVKPRATLTALLRKYASRRRLLLQGALLQEILDTGCLSLEACPLESEVQQGLLQGLDSCTSEGILRPGCVLILCSEADDAENSQCWLGVLGSTHLEIPEVLHRKSPFPLP